MIRCDKCNREIEEKEIYYVVQKCVKNNSTFYADAVEDEQEICEDCANNHDIDF